MSNLKFKTKLSKRKVNTTPNQQQRMTEYLDNLLI